MNSAAKMLLAARESGTYLSGRSAELLSLDGEQARSAFAAEMRDTPYFQFDHITLMETMKKESDSVGMTHTPTSLTSIQLSNLLINNPGDAQLRYLYWS